VYRLWQLWRALTGVVTPADMHFVATILTPAEQQLFAVLPRYDQRHAIDVVRLLVREGHADHVLLATALLHDIGKVSDAGAPLGLGWYGVIVVAQRVPMLYNWLQRWCEPVQRHGAHEMRSVHRAQHAAVRPAVIAVLHDVARHADTPMVRLLHEADDRC
jgi:hypothetical protein